MAPKYRTEAARPSEYPTAIRLRVVCDESKAWPIDGSATLATARFRLATAATRISAIRTSPARAGDTDASSMLRPDGVAIVPPPPDIDRNDSGWRAADAPTTSDVP